MVNQPSSSPTGFFPITAENEGRCAHNSTGNVVEDAILCYCKSRPAWAGDDQQNVYLMPGTTLFFAIIAVILYSMLHRLTPLIYRKMVAMAYVRGTGRVPRRGPRIWALRGSRLPQGRLCVDSR